MMNFFRSAIPLLSAAALFALAGCAAPEKPAPPRDGELAGTFWRPSHALKFTYIEFPGDGRVLGNSGRNRFFGPVAYAAGKRLRLGPLATTREPGSEAERQYEKEFFARLEATRGYVLDGDTLMLYNEEREPLMRLVRLKPQIQKP